MMPFDTAFTLWRKLRCSDDAKCFIYMDQLREPSSFHISGLNIFGPMCPAVAEKEEPRVSQQIKASQKLIDFFYETHSEHKNLNERFFL